MGIIYDVRNITLPGGVTTAKTVFTFNTATLQSALLRVNGDVYIIAGDRGHKYLMDANSQRCYMGSEFARVGSKGESIEIKMCAVGSDDVTVSVESLVWEA